MHKATERALTRLDKVIKAMTRHNDSEQDYKSKIYISPCALVTFARKNFNFGLDHRFLAGHLNKYRTLLEEHHEKHKLFYFHNHSRELMSGYTEDLAQQKADTLARGGVLCTPQRNEEAFVYLSKKNCKTRGVW